LRGTRPDAVARFLGSRGAIISEPFRIERFVLFSARPGSGGGPYVAEQTFGLGQGYGFETGDADG
jgi:2'-5' RNA ligase